MPQDLPHLLGAISVLALTLIGTFSIEYVYKYIKEYLRRDKIGLK